MTDQEKTTGRPEGKRPASYMNDPHRSDHDGSAHVGGPFQIADTPEAAVVAGLLGTEDHALLRIIITAVESAPGITLRRLVPVVTAAHAVREVDFLDRYDDPRPLRPVDVHDLVHVLVTLGWIDVASGTLRVTGDVAHPCTLTLTPAAVACLAGFGT